jgi:hypothetical protein
MNILLKPVASCVLFIALFSTTSALAQTAPAQRSVTLQATGTFARGGEFTGTITVNRFEQRGTGIVAIGFVQGVLRRGNATATGFAGEVAWPVVVKSGNAIVAGNNRTPGASIVRVSSASPTIVPVQTTGCQVLDITLGPLDVNILGFTVSLSPVALSLAGGEGPLGALVCSVVTLLGNVAGVVDLLNSILGLLTGLLGGLTGGIGGGGTPPLP